ncbi:MAG: phytanoyl-CoA dioxygenase family protein [Lentisphaeria bacterium]|nr:phytanoyl-CoA dioxygenase family protein [Lentisphaeria bacterium]NQZ69771.1 phytanoyl-CoA dioxygenase family protein [Lentisphaeria bacterium]
MPVLTNHDIRQVHDDGVMILRGAFSEKIAESAREQLWTGLKADPNDSSTWPDKSDIFDIELSTDIMDGVFSERTVSALDEILGEGCWTRHENFRYHPINFPTQQQSWAEGGGWHVDGNWFDHSWTNTKQALVILPLWSTIEANGGGTRVKAGSYKIAAEILKKLNGETLDYKNFANQVLERCDDFSDVFVEGQAGDLVIMHGYSLHTSAVNHSQHARLTTNSCVHLKTTPDFSEENEQPSLYEQTLNCI